MKHPGFLLILAIGLTAIPRALLAQDLGDRVRVRTDARMLIGQIVALHEDRIDLALDGWELAHLEGPSYSVTRTDIRLVEISHGVGPSWRWTAWGGLGGALTGAALANVCLSGGCASNPDTWWIAGLGAVAGGGLVAVVSLLVGENERWEPVPAEAENANINPTVEFGGDHGLPVVILGGRLRF